MKPLGDRILVKPVSVDEVTAKGIIIPDVAKDKPLKGQVVAAGPGKEGRPMIVKEGDNIIYGLHSGTPIEHEGEKYLMMRETDIFAIL